MIHEETRRKLRELNLEELIEVLDMQAQDSSYLSLPFDDRIKMVVNYIYQEKYNGKVKRLLSSAKLRIPDAEVRAIHYVDRGLDHSLMLELSTCQFISTNTNLIFHGFTGSGKTYLACSIARQACRQGIRTRYVRIPDLLMEHDEATVQPQGISKLLKKYSLYKVLLLDEWLLDDLSNVELHFLFELIERRYGEVATIFCTQYKVEDWHTRLGGGILADSIMDRIVHNAVRVFSGNLNMRESHVHQGLRDANPVIRQPE